MPDETSQVVEEIATTPKALQPKRKPYFCNADQRKMQAKSVAARKENQQKALTLSLKVDEVTQQVQQQLNSYVATRLTRVRLLLDSIDERMSHETDPFKLDKLASSQAKLSIQERELAGRPLPGARRPGPERVRREGPAAPLD